jgi:hypothetical protein
MKQAALRKNAEPAQPQHRVVQSKTINDNSPAAIAQRQRMELLANSASSKNNAVQRAEDEEPLQGKFETAQRAEDEELLQGKFETAQRVEEEEPLQGKFHTAQRAEDEELLQGKFETAQRVEEEEPLQGKFETAQRAEDEEPLQSKFATVQRAEDEELLQGKFDTAQRVEEEEPLQGKFTAQRMDEEEPLQAKSTQASTTQLAEQDSAKPNNTGLPDQLKSGIESLSGMSMDHVKVHYNSAQPAQLNAHAYAQGSDIHVAPGQEKHLPHEAWHVVQQAQGRVKPTMQMKAGVPVNDDVGLETEADVMGAKALSAGTMSFNGATASLKSWSADGITASIQRLALSSSKLNVAGESHPESGPRRNVEREYATDNGVKDYWREGEFTYQPDVWFFQTSKKTHGDPYLLRAEHLLAMLDDKHGGKLLSKLAIGDTTIFQPNGTMSLARAWAWYANKLADAVDEVQIAIVSASRSDGEHEDAQLVKDIHGDLGVFAGVVKASNAEADTDVIKSTALAFIVRIKALRKKFTKNLLDLNKNRSEEQISKARSDAMLKAAEESGSSGLWKIGDDHIADIVRGAPKETGRYRVMTKKEFNADFEKWKAKKYPQKLVEKEEEPQKSIFSVNPDDYFPGMYTYD